MKKLQDLWDNTKWFKIVVLYFVFSSFALIIAAALKESGPIIDLVIGGGALFIVGYLVYNKTPISKYQINYFWLLMPAFTFLLYGAIFFANSTTDTKNNIETVSTTTSSTPASTHEVTSPESSQSISSSSIDNSLRSEDDSSIKTLIILMAKQAIQQKDNAENVKIDHTTGDLVITKDGDSGHDWLITGKYNYKDSETKENYFTATMHFNQNLLDRKVDLINNENLSCDISKITTQ
ncbi:hypothetical protein [Lactococcus formosensis]|uniref:hypothetical protein n=1 Tax=Lactococcus formosensis TaxID=1281486 RepID=UPI0031FEC6A5